MRSAPPSHHHLGHQYTWLDVSNSFILACLPQQQVMTTNCPALYWPLVVLSSPLPWLTNTRTFRANLLVEVFQDEDGTFVVYRCDREEPCSLDALCCVMDSCNSLFADWESSGNNFAWLSPPGCGKTLSAQLLCFKMDEFDCLRMIPTSASPVFVAV